MEAHRTEENYDSNDIWVFTWAWINSDDDIEKRHIVVAYTEAEKLKAYIQTYLVQESEK